MSHFAHVRASLFHSSPALHDLDSRGSDDPVFDDPVSESDDPVSDSDDPDSDSDPLSALLCASGPDNPISVSDDSSSSASSRSESDELAADAEVCAPNDAGCRT